MIPANRYQKGFSEKFRVFLFFWYLSGKCPICVISIIKCTIFYSHYNFAAIWYQSLIGICMVVWMHANAFFYFHVVFIRWHELPWHSNRSIKCQTFDCHSNGQTLAINDVWMLLPDFIVWELQCNVIPHCITSYTLEHFYLQCSLNVIFKKVFKITIKKICYLQE